MKHLFIVFAIAIISSSCSVRNQVVEIKSKSVDETEDFFIHKDENITVVYHFWKNKGMMGMVISNNSDKPIYIDWFKSSLISSGVKKTYWTDEEVRRTSGTYSNATISHLFSPYQVSSLGIGSFSAITIINRPERKTFIPPHSKIFKGIDDLKPTPFSMRESVVTKVLRNGSKGKMTEIKTKDFDYLSTPLILRNYLTWSFSENFDTEFQIDDEFWVSKVTSMSNKHFRGKVSTGVNNSFDYEMPYISPKRFFIEWQPN